MVLPPRRKEGSERAQPVQAKESSCWNGRKVNINKITPILYVMAFIGSAAVVFCEYLLLQGLF